MLVPNHHNGILSVYHPVKMRSQKEVKPAKDAKGVEKNNEVFPIKNLNGCLAAQKRSSTTYYSLPLTHDWTMRIFVWESSGRGRLAGRLRNHTSKGSRQENFSHKSPFLGGR